MADLEKRVEKLEDKFPTLEKQINTLATKVDMFISEMRDFKSEMREQNKMRADEIRNTDAKFEKLGSQIQNLIIATVVGIGAIVWALVSAVK